MSSPHVTQTTTSHSLGTAVAALHSQVLQLRDTRLDPAQLQCTETMLQLLAELQELTGTTAQPTPSAPEAAPQAPAAPAPKPKPPVSLPWVLLVEDDEINQMVASELIKQAQVNVDVASSGEEAVEAAKRKPYRLIFMDIMMPGMGGLEATRVLREDGYAMPIVGMTGATDKEAIDAAFSAGMNDYLTKPVNPDRVLSAVSRWVDAPATPELAADAAAAPDATPEAAPTSSMDYPLHEKGSAEVDELDTDCPVGADDDELPQSIPGFNMAEGLAAANHNKHLYADLLARFASNYANTADEIVACLQNDDLSTALRHAHTIKGVAANLGAIQLSETAGALEKTIARAPQKIPAYLEKLVEHLHDALNAVNEALESKRGRSALGTHEESDGIEASELLSAEEALQICQDMLESINHMEENWNAADIASQGILDTLAGTHLEHPSLLLRRAVEDFSPQKAQSICQVLQEALMKIARR